MPNRLKKSELIALCQHLLNVVKSGLPLDSSLREIAREFRGRLKIAAEEISEQLSRGASLTEALSTTRVGINPYLIAMLKAGEQTGNLSEVLYDIITLYQRNLRTERRIIANCRYPFLVFAIAISLIIVIMVKLLPKMNEVYIQLGVRHLPALTEFFLEIGHFLRHYYVVTAVIFIVLFSLATNFWTLSIFRRLRSSIELMMPVVASMVYYDAISTFSRVLSRLLKSKVPLPDALRLSKLALRNTSLQGAVEKIGDEVSKGKRFSDAVAEVDFLPPGVCWSIKVSETRGDLEDTLAGVAELYDEKFQDISDLTAGYIEPFLIIFVGLIIGMAVVSFYLPLFTIPKILGAG
ncbi:type II secretion system F family protein [Candidatus Sumerlaeota bacterium]|nr:type II secretion system F family protein [Candidatus Sumerlaeota bacterium]